MVPVKLDCFNVCSFCGDNAWIVCDEVTTHCDSCSFGLFFLWSDCADDSREGDGSALWHLVFVDEEDSVCAFDPTTYTLRQVSKFIGC